MLLSIVIPVKNGLEWLKHSLPVFLNQDINGDFEIIIIYSGSTDGLKEYLIQQPSDKIFFYSIEPNTFNHGLTRNLGVTLAKGKFVVMTVQDAKPIDRYWLDEMLKGFEDEDIVAVCGKQVVAHDIDKNPVQWYRNYSEEGIQKVKLDAGEYQKLTGNEKYIYAALDNVATCYLKEKLIIQPFRRIAFAEDIHWAHDALERGWSIAYNTKAKVEHYHFAEEKYLHSRLMIEWLSLYQILNYLPVEPRASFRLKLSWLKSILCNKKLKIRQKIFWYKHNFVSMNIRRHAYKEWMDYYRAGKIHILFDKYSKEIPIAVVMPEDKKAFL